MTTWILIIILSLITFTNRYVFFSQTITYQPSEKIMKFLSFSTQAVLTTLWIPIVFTYDSERTINYTDINYLIASIFVFILSMLKINMFLIIVMGLGVFFMLKFDLI